MLRKPEKHYIVYLPLNPVYLVKYRITDWHSFYVSLVFKHFHLEMLTSTVKPAETFADWILPQIYHIIKYIIE